MAGYILKTGKKRKGGRRPNPRSGQHERRRTNYVVTFTTDKPVLPAVEWLEEFCYGAWDIRLVGFEDTDFTHKVIQVMFEYEMESDYFVARFGSSHCVCKVLAA